MVIVLRRIKLSDDDFAIHGEFYNCCAICQSMHRMRDCDGIRANAEGYGQWN
jgi:hypothetical protein